MKKTKEEGSAPCDKLTLEEREALARQGEEDALIKVFDTVRQKSRKGLLAQPNDWVELGFVPSHMDSEEFERYVYAYLEEYLHQQGLEAEVEPAKVFRSASTTVGVSQIFLASKKEPESASKLSDGGKSDSEEAVERGSFAQDKVSEGEESSGKGSEGEESDGSNEEPVTKPLREECAIPPGFELVEIEGELALLPLEEEELESHPDCVGILPPEGEVLESYPACCGIKLLEGEKSYYLYDKETMTDAYARWAFLSAEDDRIATFVECVRSESRIYPRPMPAIGFKNEPFSFSDDEIDELWQAVSESQEYPDIQITTASNGASYFFSTDYLTPVYAASLAEWEAVERWFYL